MPRSNENFLRWKFGKRVTKGTAPNVTLVVPGTDPGVALRAGESAIARIALESRPIEILLTDERLIMVGGETLVRFEDVGACYWIDRDPRVRPRLKTSKFHRLILELHDGREVVIEDLGQAVFPLLHAPTG